MRCFLAAKHAETGHVVFGADQRELCSWLATSPHGAYRVNFVVDATKPEGPPRYVQFHYGDATVDERYVTITRPADETKEGPC